jgi:hypothetical protein
MTKPNHDDQERRILQNLLLWRIGEHVVTVSDALAEMKLSWQQLSAWTRSDPQFAQDLKTAKEALYERLADSLLHLHEDHLDSRTARNVADNIKWTLERRDSAKFGKVVTDDAQPQLIGILQAAVQRLIEQVPVAPAPLTVVEPAKRVTFRSDDDPSDTHRP